MTLLYKMKHYLLLIIFMSMSMGINTAYSANCTSNCLSIYSNNLTNLGTSISGTVKLIDELGTAGAARSSTVHGLWTRPDGSTVLQYARIGTRLRAEFRLYTGGAPGVYTLEVIDVIKVGYTFDTTTGGSALASLNVAGASNQIPVAIINTNTTSGVAPSMIDFNSAGSFDPDGGIVSYEWNFGDGVISTEPNISHTYTVSGGYTATLTVTDNSGASTNSSVNIKILAPSPPGSVDCLNQCLSVDQISMKYRDNKNLVTGVVQLKDENGEPVYDAVVEAIWTLPDGSTVTQSSNNKSKNKANFKIPANTPGTYTLTVTGINKSGYSFAPEDNKTDFASYSLEM
ncbi:MAG: PKD domain-containing protein [Candidatus Thiodiazotropha sp. 6PLUC2]